MDTWLRPLVVWPQAPAHPCWISGTPSVKRGSNQVCGFSDLFYQLKPLMLHRSLIQELNVSNGQRDNADRGPGGHWACPMRWVRAGTLQIASILRQALLASTHLTAQGSKQRYQLTAQVPRPAESAGSPHTASDPLVPARRCQTAVTGSNTVGMSLSPSPKMRGPCCTYWPNHWSHPSVRLRCTLLGTGAHAWGQACGKVSSRTN